MNGIKTLEIACGIVATAVLGLRLTRWRSTPRSHPFTVALLLLALGVMLGQPTFLNTWLSAHTAADTHLANFSILLGDLSITTAAGYLGILVIDAWSLDVLRNWVIRGVVSAELLMLTLWAISDAPRIPTEYVGHLGGPATFYSNVATFPILVAHLAILLSILAVRVPTGIRTALLPLALAALLGIAVSALRILGDATSDTVTALLETAMRPLTLGMIFLYSLSGLIGYFLTAPHLPGEQPGRFDRVGEAGHRSRSQQAEKRQAAPSST
ncbi:hypothetical protein [Nocardia sp. NPDC127526]|uniref:hypothetical protein n=1 Tax=Nocardia sp. NPDC127526 TaxID=3345393 RepID=UPI0036329D3E